nr:Asp-tRNA(Asn)/Glu-tRNA(Gln) amidotransferase subunit GatB [Nitrospirota bacterium]
MSYEVVIGLEVHAQLLTQSKMFCACGTKFGLPANSQTCPICLGMPGTLPVINKKAVEMAVRTGLALQCRIGEKNRFARKNYFYPDLPKGYQISQYEAPICEHGSVEVGQAKKPVRIRRAHLEEDAGKNIHEAGANGSRVDLNRAGTPLLEIVTEPDMCSADEVVAYLKMLREILMYLEVCDGNMEEGSLRCEPNLSLRPVGQKEFGTKVELKNINSFKFVKEAIEYEIKRQTKVLNEGGKIHQETRLWDTVRGETVVMRSKEEAHDYRYFPDPDLVPLEISEEWIEEIRKTLPVLASEKQKQFVEKGVPIATVNVLISDKNLAKYFETVSCSATAMLPGFPVADVWRASANTVVVDLRGLTNKGGRQPEPEKLAELVAKNLKKEISGPIAKAVLEEMSVTDKSADEIIKAKGLTQVSDEGSLAKIIDEVIAKNPTQVEQYRGGKEAVLGFLVGQVMKSSGGKANPGKVNELLKKKLAG